MLISEVSLLSQLVHSRVSSDLIDDNRDDQEDTNQNELPVCVDVQQVHAVLEQRHEQTADYAAEQRTMATGHRSTADNGSNCSVTFHTNARRLRTSVDSCSLENARHRSQQARDDVSADSRVSQVDTGQSCSFTVGTDCEEASAENRLAQEEPHNQADNHNIDEGNREDAADSRLSDETEDGIYE